MLSAFYNCFKIPELKNRIIITLGLIAIYRIGCLVPTPGVNGSILAQYFENMNSSAGGGGTIFGMMGMFSGGAFERMTIFGLGIMPYISSSIIMQLLTAVIPALEKLAKEGQAGYHKINQYTRYGTLGLAIIQSFFIALWLERQGFENLMVVNNPGWGFRLITVLTLASGTLALMWLGEQIQERGIGNGISLIITAGIISSAPAAIQMLVRLMSAKTVGAAQLQPLTLLMMLVFLFGVILAITLITQAQRKIPVQYARRVVGRKVYGGQSTYIPLKVDTSGIIAIIFAQSILLFPATIASFIPSQGLQWFAGLVMRGNFVYYSIYGLLIIFFCYFYTAIVFNPVEVANQLKKHGGFIPGVRPGNQTAEYLDFVLTRITLAGAAFICIIAVMPDAIMASFKVPYLVASFFGGTGVLITVGVMLDTMKQIESHLMTRHYEGFMKSGQLRGRR
ncbi:MAG: preprotein translocase subunit SecY [Candidatus Omnitrophota bacterium]